jgi:putative ABC transport system permease protein
MKPRPPVAATRLLRLFLRDDLGEEVAGDLEEKFLVTLKRRSLWFAKVRYWYEVFNYIRPFAFRKSNSLPSNRFDMFQNYFKITARNLFRQKLYSAINIGGLTLGLTCFIAILLYVQHEYQYNKAYPNFENIYRVYQRQAGNEYLSTDYFAETPAQLAFVMEQEIPEVVHATTLWESSGLLTYGENNFFRKGLAGDSNLLKVLQFPFIEGNPKKALKYPKSIVLTKKLSTALFGDNSPIGETLRFLDIDGFQVTGVIEDAAVHSSLQYDFLIDVSYNNGYMEDMNQTGWNGNSYHTFFTLAAGANTAAVEARFPAILKKYQNPETYKNYPFKDQYYVESFGDVYFHPHINFDIGLKGNRSAVQLFMAIAFIVLLLACVNYMNLAIARSIKRAREVGMRKVAGAVRQQLLTQFLGESILITFVSLVLAVGLVYLLVPYFGRLVERPVGIDFVSNAWLVPGLILITLVVGLVSGSYPAVVMSSLKPIDVLKVKSDVKVSGFSMQRVLIIVQFAASSALIIGSAIMYQQLDFMQQKELGYDRENIISVRLRDFTIRQKFPQLSQEWSQNPEIIRAAICSSLPTDVTSSTMVKSRPGLEKSDLALYRVSAEYNYVDLFGLELVAGRNFSPDFNDTTVQNVIVNESAAAAFGWSPEESIGRDFKRGSESHYIIGVVKDFHMHSLYEPIQPLMISFSNVRGAYFSFKLRPEKLQETIQYLERSIRKVSPYPFEYEFLDDTYNNLYSAETRLGQIFGTFTLVSIVIASLGLFGLAAFMASRRTKEIGIRKVLGASGRNIVLLISKDFMMLVLIAFVVAVPISWYAMHKWLQEFAFRVEIEWWIFAVAGLLAFFIANISIGYQSVKAASMDPVDSLRGE